MTITVSGLPGSGKTALVRRLSDHLNQPWVSIGDIRGRMATERGLTIDELNAQSHLNTRFDREVDEYQTQLAQQEPDTIFDGWMSWFFIPKSFKLFLTVDLKEAGKRIFAARQHDQTRSDEPMYQSAEDAEATIKKRLLDSQERYLALYGVDFLEKTHYDLILDTTHMTPDEVYAAVEESLKNHQAS